MRNKALGVMAIQVFSKLTGIVREFILISFFGGSIIFADYLRLMTFGHLVTLFSTEGGLSANLLPKFAQINREKKSFFGVRKDSFIISIFVSIVVFLLQFLALKILISTTYNYYPIIIISSITSGMAFYFNIGQISLLSIGNYSNYYKSNFFRSFVFVILLYPLLVFFEVLGAVLNRFISVGIQYFNTWFIVKRKLKLTPTNEGLKLTDFNIWLFLTNNSIMLWFLFLRLNASFIDGIDIIFLSYAFILASAYDGVILKSLSLFSLERLVNGKINILKIVQVVSIISLVLIILILLIGENIFNYIFTLISNFSKIEINKIFLYFLLLLIGISSSGILNILFQKIVSTSSNYKFLLTKRYIMSLFVVIIGSSLLNFIKNDIMDTVICFIVSLTILNIIFIFKIIKNDRSIQ